MRKLIIEHLRNIVNESEKIKVDLSLVRIKKQWVNNLLVFSPYYENKPIGGFRLKKFEDGYKVESVSIYEAYRNNGIGKNMYLHMIKTLQKENMPLYSDNAQTPAAKAIWEKLVDKGIAVRTENGYKSKN